MYKVHTYSTSLPNRRICESPFIIPPWTATLTSKHIWYTPSGQASQKSNTSSAELNALRHHRDGAYGLLRGSLGLLHHTLTSLVANELLYSPTLLLFLFILLCPANNFIYLFYSIFICISLEFSFSIYFFFSLKKICFLVWLAVWLLVTWPSRLCLILLRLFPRVWSLPELSLELLFDSSAKLCTSAADHHPFVPLHSKQKYDGSLTFFAFTFHAGRTDGLKKKR